MVDTKELANSTSNFNFRCLPLACSALICSCSAESWVPSCASVSRGLHISEANNLSWQSTDSSLIYILLSTGPNRQANKGWQSWDASLSGNCCLLGCYSLLKYAVCLYVAKCTQRFRHSVPLDYDTADHNAYMHPLQQSFLLVSTIKKKNPDLCFSNDRRCFRWEISRKKGREREKRESNG